MKNNVVEASVEIMGVFVSPSYMDTFMSLKITFGLLHSMDLARIECLKYIKQTIGIGMEIGNYKYKLFYFGRHILIGYTKKKHNTRVLNDVSQII